MNFRLALSPLFALTLAACGGQVVTSAEGKGPSCEEACAQAKTCSSEVDVDACVEDCTEDDTLSFAGQEAMTKCLEKQDCETANAAPALACILGEVNDTEPSEFGQTFCSTSLGNFADCQAETASGQGSAVPDEEQCLDMISLMADEFLSELNDCLDGSKTCQNAQLCFGIEVASRVDLAALQDPQPGDPGLVGLLASLFGDGLALPPLGGGTEEDSSGVDEEPSGDPVEGAGGQSPAD